MMTSGQIRQSFLDFFKSKQHTIVPSSSLLPEAPNLLFTNAGMNQFVPIFLGRQKPDVSKWPGAAPGLDTRAADTQKCIRAGGKHNDLEDVGLDTYHHTFFEMLGNWSFGDYFKQEAIEWAWELLTEVWKFPKERLYATVYCPHMDMIKWQQELKIAVSMAEIRLSGGKADFDAKVFGEPGSDAIIWPDEESACFWAEQFLKAHLDPLLHVVPGNKKDNFWMMGETGPCGPCSEIHIDLTPLGDTQGKLVNQGDARCIEIWNLVFIQFNANPDGTFSPLPARHVDTGMGFERVTGIIQNTKNFTDFSGVISNYETDIFRPIFDKLEELSGKKYGSTLPMAAGSTGNLPVPLGNLPSGTGVTPDLQTGAGTSGASVSQTGVGVEQDARSHSAGLVAQRHGQVARATQPAPGATYSRRNLPHFEKPWAIYHIILHTIGPRKLSPAALDVVFDCILHWRESRYRLVAACVMPDHAHIICQPGVKEEDKQGNPVFWPLSEILHSIKSYSANEVNKLDNVKGTLWQEERFDRYMRSDSDLQEKFHYVCRNPWATGLVLESEPWPWLWTPDIEAANPYVPVSARKGSTGNLPVPLGNLPSGTAGTPDLETTAGTSGAFVSQMGTGLQDDARSHSAGLVAQRHGQVARATPEQIQLDVAFRVIADHIRTLSFAIADGIQPGNTDRNYVLRRILRRAVRYGRTLGFHEPFFYKLVDVLAETMGHVFPEIREKRQQVQEVIQREESAFNKTLDRGIEIFGAIASTQINFRKKFDEHWSNLKHYIEGVRRQADVKHSTQQWLRENDNVRDCLHALFAARKDLARTLDAELIVKSEQAWRIWLDEHKLSQMIGEVAEALKTLRDETIEEARFFCKLEEFKKQLRSFLKAAEARAIGAGVVSGGAAFLLYDTYGFPLDLTELMARERGLTVDKPGFERLMDEQRARARSAQKKEVIEVSLIETKAATKFVGYDELEASAKVLEVVGLKEKTAVLLDLSTCYAEGGGQVGDTGQLRRGGQFWRIVNAQKVGNVFMHYIEERDVPAVGSEVEISVDAPRRAAIQRHHTVTHLLHWALHEVASKEASQKGSYVGPEKLTFDFNSAPLSFDQINRIDRLVNEKILENATVSWNEVPYAAVKSRKDVMQFFGEKYGDNVRVVQIGGHPKGLDGYSMELCGGTHTRATGEIGFFRIVSETAIAAGVRRIEAVAGLPAYEKSLKETEQIEAIAKRLNAPIGELDKKIESLLAHQKELEKQLKVAQQREASNIASHLKAQAAAISGIPAIIHNLGAADGDFLQSVADVLKGSFKGVIVLGGLANNAVSLVAAVSPDFTTKVQAGKIIQVIAPIVGGKGGGKPDNARGGGKDAARLDEALVKAAEFLKAT